MKISPKFRTKKLRLIICTPFWEVFAHFLIGKGPIVFRVCDKVILKPVCSATETSYNTESLYVESLTIIFLR